MPLRPGHKIPTAIEDERGEDQDEDAEDKAQVMDDEGFEEVEARDIERAFRVLTENANKYGRSDRCRGCTAMANSWETAVAHPEECRNIIIKIILEDGGVGKRVEQATQKAWNVENWQRFMQK